MSGWRHSLGIDINSAGLVAGLSSMGGGDTRATLWNNGTIIDLDTLGGYASEAHAINDAGQVVGFSYTTGNTSYRATLWNNGTIIDLGTLGGDISSAQDINNMGLVVGHSDTTNNTEKHATLWNGTTATDLNSLLDASIISAGWVLRSADSINDNGWIAGTAYNNFTGQMHAFLLSEAVVPVAAIPEPETYAMLLAGLGLLGFAGRKKTSHTVRTH